MPQSMKPTIPPKPSLPPKPIVPPNKPKPTVPPNKPKLSPTPVHVLPEPVPEAVEAPAPAPAPAPASAEPEPKLKPKPKPKPTPKPKPKPKLKSTAVLPPAELAEQQAREETARIAAEEETARLKAEAQRIAEERRRLEEEMQLERERLEQLRLERLEAERLRLVAERERKEAEARVEAERRAAEEAARRAAEEEAKRKAEEERLRLETEARLKSEREAAEEAARLAAEEEARRLAQLELERLQAEATASAKKAAQVLEAAGGPSASAAAPAEVEKVMATPTPKSTPNPTQSPTPAAAEATAMSDGVPLCGVKGKGGKTCQKRRCGKDGSTWCKKHTCTKKGCGLKKNYKSLFCKKCSVEVEAAVAITIAKRILDLQEEDGAPRSPIAGLFPSDKKIAGSLEDSLVLVAKQIPQYNSLLKSALKGGHRAARKFPDIPKHLLAAIVFYTLEDIADRQKSPYYLMNGALRARSREEVKLWKDYIWLLLNALKLLPAADVPIVYRGMTVDADTLGDDYNEGEQFVWSGFTSTATAIGVMKNFLGTEGPRTLFTLTLIAHIGRDLRDISLYPSENEILLPPNMQFEVTSKLDAGHGLTMVQCTQVEADDELLPLSNVAAFEEARAASSAGMLSAEAKKAAAKVKEHEAEAVAAAAAAAIAAAAKEKEEAEDLKRSAKEHEEAAAIKEAKTAKERKQLSLDREQLEVLKREVAAAEEVRIAKEREAAEEVRIAKEQAAAAIAAAAKEKEEAEIAKRSAKEHEEQLELRERRQVEADRHRAAADTKAATKSRRAATVAKQKELIAAEEERARSATVEQLAISLCPHRQDDPSKVARDESQNKLLDLLKRVKRKDGDSGDASNILKASADQALAWIAAIPVSDVPKFAANFLEKLEASSLAGPSGRDNPLHERLEGVKLVMAHFAHTSLRFCSRPMVGGVDLEKKVLEKLSKMVIEPAIKCIRNGIRSMQERVCSDPEYYRGQLEELSGCDKTIYNEVFNKRTNSNPDDFAKMCAAIDALSSQVDSSTPPERKQPARDMLKLMTICVEVAPEFETTITRLLCGIEGIELVFRSETKGLYRIAEKSELKGPAAKCNGGDGMLNDKMPLDCSAVCDVVGCLVICKDFICMRKVIQCLEENVPNEEGVDIYQVKSRWRNPSDGGWRDVMCMLAISKGSAKVVCEVQIVLKTMYVARKDLDGHEAYVKFRSFLEMLNFAGLLQTPSDDTDGGDDEYIEVAVDSEGSDEDNDYDLTADRRSSDGKRHAWNRLATRRRGDRASVSSEAPAKPPRGTRREVGSDAPTAAAAGQKKSAIDEIFESSSDEDDDLAAEAAGAAAVTTVAGPNRLEGDEDIFPASDDETDNAGVAGAATAATASIGPDLLDAIFPSDDDDDDELNGFEDGWSEDGWSDGEDDPACDYDSEESV